MSNPCTCGVKFTGGLCSSWCDSLRPAEPEPSTERSKPHFNPMFLTRFFAPPQAVPMWPSFRSAKTGGAWGTNPGEFFVSACHYARDEYELSTTPGGPAQLILPGKALENPNGISGATALFSPGDMVRLTPPKP
jgi:hypothetical protein